MNAAVTAVRHDRQALLKFRRWYESDGPPRRGGAPYALSGRGRDWTAASGPRRCECKSSGARRDAFGFSRASAGHERACSVSGRDYPGDGLR